MSCSEKKKTEVLAKQNLFINSILAQLTITSFAYFHNTQMVLFRSVS